MSKKVKIWLIIASVLVILGTAISVVAIASVGWGFTKLNTKNYKTNTYDITEEFTDISIKTDTAGIAFLPSDDEKCKVVCYEEAKTGHAVSVSDGVLTVSMVDERKWYDYIGMHFNFPMITVYLPKNEYSSLVIDESTGNIDIEKEFTFESIDISVSTGDVECYASAKKNVKITASTGDIYVKNISAASLNASVSTGKITVSDSTFEGDVKANVSTGKTVLGEVKCKNVISRGSTGNVSLKDVFATGEFSIKRSTGDVEFESSYAGKIYAETSSGDVEFEASDAGEIYVKTSSGDVEGSLLSNKVFIIDTSLGDIDIPRSITGGRCEITTSSGDISIKIKK